MSEKPAVPKPAKAPPRSYALMAIAGLFFASALARGMDMGVVLMTEDAMVAAVVPAPLDPMIADDGARMAAFDRERAPTAAELASFRPIVPAAKQTVTPRTGGAESCEAAPLFASLRERSAELDALSDALDARASRLDAAEIRVNERIAALQAAREELEMTISHVKGAQARDIDHLVTMYAAMKPKQAGDLFNVMDVSFASEFLVRMKPEIAAQIIANMDPQKAYVASLTLARRNENAPDR